MGALDEPSDGCRPAICASNIDQTEARHPSCVSVRAFSVRVSKHSATAERLDGGHNDSEYRLHTAGPDSAANDSQDIGADWQSWQAKMLTTDEGTKQGKRSAKSLEQMAIE